MLKREYHIDSPGGLVASKKFKKLKIIIIWANGVPQWIWDIDKDEDTGGTIYYGPEVKIVWRVGKAFSTAPMDPRKIIPLNAIGLGNLGTMNFSPQRTDGTIINHRYLNDLISHDNNLLFHNQAMQETIPMLYSKIRQNLIMPQEAEEQTARHFQRINKSITPQQLDMSKLSGKIDAKQLANIQEEETQ